MTLREDIASANASKAHLLDDLSMKDEYAQRAMKRAAIYTAVGACLIIGIAITYQVKRHHGD